MLNRLDRYIGISVINAVLAVLLIVVGLETLFAIIDELGATGKGQYTTFKAVQHVLLTVPRRIYEIFPMACLVGGLLGLGSLASSSELVVMRAAGVSLWKIIMAMMQAGAVLMVLAFCLGEYVAPQAEQAAQVLKAEARGGKAVKTKYGSWVRDNDEYNFIQDILDVTHLRDVVRYKFKDQQLRSVTKAQQLFYRDGVWQAEGVQRTVFAEDGQVSAQLLAQASWPGILAPKLLEVVTVKPERLSVQGLYRYIGYLHDNKLDAANYELAFWKKLLQPLAIAVMIFLAVPCILGPLRSVGLGIRLVVGLGLGFGFYILNQVFGPVSLVYALPPLLGALLPTLVFALFGYGLLRRVH